MTIYDELVGFGKWKDANFYTSTGENGSMDYYPKSSSKYYNILKLIKFLPQTRYKLEEIIDLYDTGRS